MQRVLITGASRGIGRACAHAFARHGAHVALNHPGDDAAVDEVAREVVDLGGRALIAPADVADVTAIRAMVSQVHEQLGGIDALVLNAGICPWVPFFEITEEGWDRVIDVNLKGQFFVAQAAAQLMVQDGIRGRIVSISSVSAVTANLNASHYAASKGGVSALVKTLAGILGPYGITCNAVLPGPIATEMNGYEGLPGRRDELEQRIPLGRIGQADDIAAVVFALAQNGFGFVTGAEVIADGGVMASSL